MLQKIRGKIDEASARLAGFDATLKQLSEQLARLASRA